MSARASIVVPTRARPQYLDVALASIAPQAVELGAEVLVVDDGALDANRRVAERHTVRYLRHDSPRGPNAARNTGIAAATGDLLVLVDDDIGAPDGWLAALIEGAERHPGHDVFGGPIRARLEGPAPHGCGREPAPITTLDLGTADRDAELVWSANMAIRRRALERVGPLDAGLATRPGAGGSGSALAAGSFGDEEEWQRRHLAGGGRTRYLAAAGVEHRRAGDDARLRSLTRAAWTRGRHARRYDVAKGTAPPLRHELRVIAGCAWHTVARRCPFGIAMGAEAAGRLAEGLRARS